jgi:Domain of unknown function (DUF1772)
VGLLVGALLFEAVVLVPYWQSLSAERFSQLHREVGPRLYRFFAPITAAATSLAVGNAAAATLTSSRARWATAGTAVCLLSMLGLYIAYFAKANARLTTVAHHPETVDPSYLSKELSTWALLHRLRLAIGLAGLACSMSALTT